jgi:hypothetical protein
MTKERKERNIDRVNKMTKEYKENCQKEGKVKVKSKEFKKERQ